MQKDKMKHFFFDVTFSFILVSIGFLIFGIPELTPLLAFQSFLVAFIIAALAQAMFAMTPIKDTRTVPDSLQNWSFLATIGLVSCLIDSGPVTMEKFFILIMVVSFIWLILTVALIARQSKKDTL
jgi:hypothetical protein